jgi:hypothetical protein
MAAQLLDLLACLVGAVEPLDAARAFLGKGSLELGELAGELVVGAAQLGARRAVGLPRRAGGHKEHQRCEQHHRQPPQGARRAERRRRRPEHDASSTNELPDGHILVTLMSEM